jgi:hypothetical protein
MAVRARGAVRADAELLVDDFARQTFDARGVRAARAGQPDISRVNAEIIHQMQELDLFFDGRLGY